MSGARPAGPPSPIWPDGDLPRGAHRADKAKEAEGADAVVLRTACQSLGLEVAASEIDAMLRYLALLQRWNATYNLTAVRDPQAMLTQHLADCLAAVAALERVTPDGSAQRILDVGSGGGLPGVLLAIHRADWQVVCVDAVAKKAAFVRQIAGALGLVNLRVEHGRVEQLAAAACAEPFDLITARAFATLPELVRLTRRHLRAAGHWMAMKGQVPQSEIAALPPDIDVFHVEPLAVPGLAAQRCLVWMRLRRDT